MSSVLLFSSAQMQLYLQYVETASVCQRTFRFRRGVLQTKDASLDSSCFRIHWSLIFNLPPAASASHVFPSIRRIGPPCSYVVGGGDLMSCQFMVILFNKKAEQPRPR